MPKPSVASESAHPRQGILAQTTMEDTGLYWTDGGQHEKISGPFQVPHRVRDPEGRSYGVMVTWHSEDGPREVLVHARRFADAPREIAKDFLDLGMDVHTARFDDFVEYVRVSGKLAPLVHFTKEIGWFGEHVFVLPDEIIAADGHNEKVIADPTISRAHRFKTAGTLNQWREKISKRSIGNSRLVTPVSGGFAGPLLAIEGGTSSGIHLKGKSTDGKTTAQQVGGSVLGGGDPKDGFIRSWLSTANALERTANSHNHATLFLDELSQIDPREAQRAVYTIANGTGKARLDRELFQRPALEWQLFFVSSGEVSLADHAQQRTKGGAEVRMLDIPADAGAGMGVFENLHGATSPAAFAIQLRQDALKYYGSPLREFLKCLIALSVAQRREMIECWSAEFLKSCQLDNANAEVERAAKPMALIAAAGEMASAFGITGWPKGEAINGVLKCFNAWRAQRGGDTVAHDDQQYLGIVRLFLQLHENSRFEPIAHGQHRGGRKGLLNPKNYQPESGPALKGGFINRAGYKHVYDGDTEFLFLPDVFEAEVCKGINHRAVLAVLDKRRVLRRQHPALTVKQYIPQLGTSTRVYAISRTILEGDE
jgi:putative DNA primase/helicase